jgi:peptide/nickel transport system substrate-binding protein
VITKALEDYANSSDLTVQKQAMYTIEKVILDDLPVIVLTNRTGFDLYSQKNFVGWPTIQNPYCNGMNNTSMGLEIVMLNIHLK